MPKCIGIVHPLYKEFIIFFVKEEQHDRETDCQCFQYNKYSFYTMQYKAMNHLVHEVQNQEKVMNIDSYML